MDLKDKIINNKILHANETIRKPKQAVRKRIRKMRLPKIHLIENPKNNPRIIFSYRMPSDIFITDSFQTENKYIDIFQSFNDFKKISNVFHEKDQKLIGCILVDRQMFVPPIQLLIQRLQTLGDKNAYDLSLTIGLIVKKMNGLKKIKKNIDLESIFRMESYEKFLNGNNELVHRFSENLPIMICRASNIDDISAQRVFQINFNYNFVYLIGDNIRGFLYKLMKKGLPNGICIDKDYFQTLNHILIHVFFPPENKEILQYIITTKNKNIKVNPTSYINQFEESNYKEIFAVEVYDINESDMKMIKWDKLETEAKQRCNFLNKEENFNLILEKNMSDVHTIEWFKAFYPNMNVTCLENVANQNEIRCGYKEISKIQ